jgi:hypothetical protein
LALAAYRVGGYVGGRLRTPIAGAGVDEIEFRDGSHGLAVWPFATLMTALLSLWDSSVNNSAFGTLRRRGRPRHSIAGGTSPPTILIVSSGPTKHGRRTSTMRGLRPHAYS